MNDTPENEPHELGRSDSGRPSLSEAMRELVFGAEDGMVSILGLVTGVAAGAQSTNVVLLAGVTGAVSGAVSMAAGNYLGVKSHIEVLQNRLSAEERSIRENPRHERAELVDFYRSRGLTHDEVEAVVPAIERNQDLMMEEMAAHELGISPSELKNPVWRAFWIFTAYILASAFPVLPYALLSLETAMLVSILVTIVALFTVGALKTVYTGGNALISGLEMLGIALAAGIAGFAVGRLVRI